MKAILFFLMLASFGAAAQVPGTAEKQDTIFGLAVVIDTVPEMFFVPSDSIVDANGWTTISYDPAARQKFIIAVIQSYTVTTYTPPGEFSGMFPHVTAVAYYRFEDCTEIPFSQLIAFKH